jgi:hypothetical protein
MHPAAAHSKNQSMNSKKLYDQPTGVDGQQSVGKTPDNDELPVILIENRCLHEAASEGQPKYLMIEAGRDSNCPQRTVMNVLSLRQLNNNNMKQNHSHDLVHTGPDNSNHLTNVDPIDVHSSHTSPPVETATEGSKPLKPQGNYKCLLKTFTVQKVERRGKCHHNKAHSLAKGDLVLVIEEPSYHGRNEKARYCLECSERIVEQAITKVESAAGEIGIDARTWKSASTNNTKHQ